METRSPERDAGYRDVSFWMDTLPGSLRPRQPLEGDLDVDVAIMGAGYTGLWTAWYLKAIDPGLRIAVVEKEIAGFGASGRNGGWCSALFSATHAQVARGAGREAAVALQRALFATVDEVGRVADEQGIDAQFTKGGTLVLATCPAHVGRLQQEAEEAHELGFSPDDYQWLDEREAAGRVNAARTLGGLFTPHCARINPARLVRGLAEAVERAGVPIYERTPVTELTERSLRVPGGRVRAEVVVRATEAWTAMLPGHRRVYLPVYSLVIATEPLPPSFWEQVGWHGRETLGDGRHVIIYAQRTADDRIVFGGRGAPYHLGSRVAPAFDREPAVFDSLRQALVELFPDAADAAVTHRWGGPVAAPRDWYSSVGYDRRAGLAWAGGYVGDGVGASNLAGRTLADLIAGRDTDLVRLPWVGHRSRRWEPEPLRWLGVNAAFRLAQSSDRAEGRTGRPARRAQLLWRLLGR
jgi:glycine/D-amino acid oxidase-like deaminating enzyme